MMPEHFQRRGPNEHSWDYKRTGYKQAVSVILRLWPTRHNDTDRPTIKRAIAQARRCKW